MNMICGVSWFKPMIEKPFCTVQAAFLLEKTLEKMGCDVRLFSIGSKLVLSSLLSLLSLWAGSAVAKNPYPNGGVCDGLPKVNVNTISGTCLGVVASDLKMPRGVLPLSDAEIWVTEMGSWEKNHGRLSRLSLQGNGHFVRSTLLDGLDRPHAIVQSRDGWVYVAEAGRIVRLNPKASTVVAETVLTGLPDDGHHPLKQMLFDANGDVYLSMGAKTDHCEGKDNAAVGFPCQETRGERATASIWKITSLLNQPRISVYARGLRNAMGMAWGPKGALVVTDNGRDNINQADKKLSDAMLPHDELNVVKPRRDYGWPYCYDNNRLSPEYRMRSKACAGKAKPVQLLPAHSAPLGIMLYPNDGDISALRGQLLIALHGYRDTGHRVIAVNAETMASSHEVVGAWAATDNQPMGAPVELRASPSGALYITDDRNGALLRLTRTPR